MQENKELPFQNSTMILAQELIDSGVIEKMHPPGIDRLVEMYLDEGGHNGDYAWQHVFANLVGKENPSAFINVIALGYAEKGNWDDSEARYGLFENAQRLVGKERAIQARAELGLGKGEETLLQKSKYRQEVIEQFQSNLLARIQPGKTEVKG